MKHTILIVEDDSLQREIIADSLKSLAEQYNCVVAKDGFHAIELVTEHFPVLILVDWEITKMTGVECIRAIRKLANCQNVPILMITGKDMEAHIEEAIDAGANDYIEKPVSKKLLMPRLKVMLKLAHFQKEQDLRTEAIEFENKELALLTKVLEEATDKLFESEERYKTLAKNFPNGTIGVYNSNLEATFLSGKEFEILKIDTDELIGRTLQEAEKILSAPMENLVHCCKEAFKGKEQYSETNYLGNIYIQRTVPLTEKDGTIQHVMVVSQNITQVRNTEKRLRESKALIESINRLTPHFVFTFDLERRKYTYFNRNPLKHLGYSSKQIKQIGKNFLPQIMSKPDLHRVLKYLDDFKNKKDGELGEYLQQLVGGDGRIRWILSHELVFRRNKDGVPVEIIGSAQDITELKEYEQQLLRLNKSKDRVLSTVAHDLRNPIQTIKGMLEVLGMSLQNSSEQDKKMMGMVKNSCEKALGLIAELLEISKMEEENYTLETEEIDFREFIAETLEPFKIRVSNKGLNLVLNLSEQEVFVQVNEAKFARVIENLMTNAKKFTSEGGKIKVSTKVQSDNILISIADTGIGIPSELQSIIFDRFSKAGREGLKGEKSTGLGMSIVKQIVELHQGKIWLESEEDKGATFFIEIPKVGEKSKE
ncbi:MAG: PAS domain S-box-containing protein [Arenicella sp.]|jgi:PAS domain S-box-containing protein